LSRPRDNPMLPSILAKQLQAGLSDYIKATFPMTTPGFRESLPNLLAKKDAVFHAPFVAVRLPFRVADDSQKGFFKSIHPAHKPYVHQQKAFQRLAGDDGRSTLIATGTGSGKTECFLYPILEYCYNHRGEKGIKALIIYPMNALASDQARRIAQLIHTSPELRGNVTAGMYIGGRETESCKAMSEGSIITDRDVMLGSPPDILLTNYKMLDYMLVRPKDAAIWADNSAETLKYVAVDELHTFDGAQGTDLACLLRRLKSRLFTQQGHICCIGTSATMGGKGSTEGILNYAHDVFGEPFEDEAVVTEDRVSPEEFFRGSAATDFTVPGLDAVGALDSAYESGDQRAFLETAAKAWLDGFAHTDIMGDAARLALGAHLMGHGLTRELLSHTNGGFFQNEAVCEALGGAHPELRDAKAAELAIDALYALISHARSVIDGNTRPFLTVQVHVWFKEQRRLLAKVAATGINYMLDAELNEQQSECYLPAVNCRDCGETGWASVADEHGKVKLTNLNAFYNAYFNGSEKIRMMYPRSKDNAPDGMTPAFLCPKCLQLDVPKGLDNTHNCSSCGTDQIPVIFAKTQERSKHEGRGFRCPHCGSQSGLAIVGVRSVTAISACVTQLFASKFNDDKKTLAFSDNVQDAAHRAGFFNSRTWRPSLRSAMQQFVLAGGDGLCLQEFSDRFVAHWREKLPTVEQFVSHFTAPNMTWMEAYERMILNGKFGGGQYEKTLMNNIEYRLRYEIMLEYGLYSRIGRTLEKTGGSVLSFPQGDVAVVVDRSLERAINEIGDANREFTEALFGKIVIGFLKLLSSNGAFDDLVFNKYTQSCGNSFLLTNKQEKWLPGHSARNTPRFVYQALDPTKKKLDAFDAMTGKGPYSDWVRKCFGILKIDPADTKHDEISKIVLEECQKQGLLLPMSPPADYKVWGLSKKKTMVSSKVKQLVCDECGHALSAGAENEPLWRGAPCQRKHCKGKLRPGQDLDLGYYGRLYSGGAMVRVVARDHTGLLERKDREKLEQSFKSGGKDRKPWDTNVLSCTPTLELGIDIGDLSSVILCSVPPGQAQYLQRTGRAGRKDGNALNVAVANAKAHDLFFYNEPLEMIAGNVAPPKVFLEAPAVLERQFLAYSMDCWVKTGVSESAVPKSISACISKLEARDPGRFPFNFLAYAKGNISKLLRTFLQMFPDLGDAEKDLTLHAKGSGTADGDESPMYLKVLKAFESLKSQRDALMASVKQLKKQIKELEARPKDSSYDEEIKTLDAEWRALSHVVLNIDQKGVWEFLSDEGLLPNYAFPESGVVLKAVLTRKEQPVEGAQEPSNKRPKHFVYEYNRAAASAISEFAPFNNFYADGRRLKINQVDMSLAEACKWRLCPECPHAQIEETGKNVRACPKCGSQAWGDQGQVRSMLKVRMVYSKMDYGESVIDDESEDRKKNFYCKQMLVDVKEEDITKAFSMNNSEFAFGYEHVKKAVLREINCGETDTVGEKLAVAGQEDIRKGFRICRDCGRIQGKNGKIEHSYTCKSRNTAGGAGACEEHLFLYREFETEALRILIPATTMDSTKVRLESFIAAFMLGMKEYFGNVDHLRATVSEVPAPDGAFRKQYLVIYDSVPGGTGYLKQLMNKRHSLIEIFEKALSVLEKCGCKEDSRKDGCYRCLYAYRQSQNIGQVSRQTAIQLLKRILSGKDNLDDKGPNLDKIQDNKLFESELERQFIAALDRMGSNERLVSLHKEMVNGKEGFLLTIGDCLWEIEPQVELGKVNGVALNTRADFVLWPIRVKGDQKPVAIYTDGFKYHQDSVADDAAKREAIRRSGRFRVWVLTWKDVQSVSKPQGDYATATLDWGKMPSGLNMYVPNVEKLKAGAIKPLDTPPMELLAQYLVLADAERLFAGQATAYALSLVCPQDVKDRGSFDRWGASVQEISGALGLDAPTFQFGESFFGTWSPRSSNSHITVFTGIAKADSFVCAVLDDGEDSRTAMYEAEWNGFWHFYNVMQFLEGFAAASTCGLQSANVVQAPQMPATAEPGAGWSASVMADLSDEAALAFASKCAGMGIPAPDSVGFELEGDDGFVAGEAEMAWLRPKVAYLRDDQANFREAFAARGWKTVTAEDAIQADWWSQ